MGQSSVSLAPLFHQINCCQWLLRDSFLDKKWDSFFDSLISVLFIGFFFLIINWAARNFDDMAIIIICDSTVSARYRHTEKLFFSNL